MHGRVVISRKLFHSLNTQKSKESKHNPIVQLANWSIVILARCLLKSGEECEFGLNVLDANGNLPNRYLCGNDHWWRENAGIGQAAEDGHDREEHVIAGGEDEQNATDYHDQQTDVEYGTSPHTWKEKKGIHFKPLQDNSIDFLTCHPTVRRWKTPPPWPPDDTQTSWSRKAAGHTPSSHQTPRSSRTRSCHSRIHTGRLSNREESGECNRGILPISSSNSPTMSSLVNFQLS